jgi:putative spermidine/putrescine transport system substrate-binding protein
MTPTRRHLLTAAPALLLPSRVSAAPRAPLTFAAYAGLFQELFEPAVVAPFAKAHPESGVFYYGVPSSTQILATLRRQRTEPKMDVALLDLAEAKAATDEGLVEPLTAKSLPILADLAPSALFPGIAGPALFSEPLVMLHDTARAEAPPTWRALWTKQNDHTIAIPAPPDSIGIGFTLIAAHLFGGGGELHAWRDGLNAIADLAPRVQTWQPRPDVYHVVTNGDARFGVGWNMPAQVFADRFEGRLGVSFPADGTISRVTTVNLVKGAPQADAARAFITHLLGIEAQRTMVEQMHLGPFNAKTKYPRAALERTANTPARAAAAMQVDWAFVESGREQIIRHWRETIPATL